MVLNTIYTYLATYGLNIIAAIVIFIVGRILVGVLSRLVERVMTRSHADATLITFVKHFTYVALLAFVVIMVLGRLGVQTASFVAVLGAAGLAIGLALQGSLSNFAAGVLMLIFRPFKAGDYIEAAGTAGTVREIQIFCTILNTPDHRRVIVPNAAITSGNITNFSANETRRVDMIFSVSYDDDLQQAKQILQEAIASDPRVLQEPAPLVAVSELGDNSVNLVARPWVKASDYFPTYFALTERIKTELQAQGLTIPYPQRDLHIKNGGLAPVDAGQ